MKNITKGFSLIELLITLAIVTALAGIGLAVYTQYQKRAYNTAALQQGFSLRQAIEASMASRSTSASTLFSENRMLSFGIDGSLTCLAGCSGLTLANLFPGFNHQRGVNLQVNFTTVPSYTVQTGHCKALVDEDQYDGWILSDNQEAVRAAIAADVSEISQCSAVMAGEEPIPTAPTAPTAPGDNCFCLCTCYDGAACPSGQNDCLSSSWSVNPEDVQENYGLDALCGSSCIGYCWGNGYYGLETISFDSPPACPF